MRRPGILARAALICSGVRKNSWRLISSFSSRNRDVLREQCDHSGLRLCLRGLNDRELADIGIARDQIDDPDRLHRLHTDYFQLL